jgi:Tfp pilus assembly protein FimT
MPRHRRPTTGLTVVEVLVATVILAVGLLALAGTGAVTTRMIARGQRAAAVSTLAAARLEQLRRVACVAPVNGHEDIARGSTPVARLRWTFRENGRGVRSILLVYAHPTTPGHWRSDTLETQAWCPA